MKASRLSRMTSQTNMQNEKTAQTKLRRFPKTIPILFYKCRPEALFFIRFLRPQWVRGEWN